MALNYLIDENVNPNLSVGENLEELILAALASEEDEYQDRLVYLPLP
jgi:hypothetical protein